MKKFPITTTLVFVAILAAAVRAFAEPITGELSFNGMVTAGPVSALDGSWAAVNSVSFFDADWSGWDLAANLPDNPGDYQGLLLDPTDGSLSWGTGNATPGPEFLVASFVVTSTNYEQATQDSFSEGGFGIAYLTGFDPTQATWSVNAWSDTSFGSDYGEGGASFTALGIDYQAQPAITPQFRPGFHAAPVPDPASTASLLAATILLMLRLPRHRIPRLQQ